MKRVNSLRDISRFFFLAALIVSVAAVMLFGTLETKASENNSAETISTEADSDAVTFTNYTIYAYRDEAMGTPPNGVSGTDSSHVCIKASFDGKLALTDADAAANSFVVAASSSVNTSSKTVSVSDNELTIDLAISNMPGGVISFNTDKIEGLTCDGKEVYWPSDWKTVVPTGLKFHVVDMVIGTETTPASITIEVDHSANVQSMNHILWTSNGESIFKENKDGSLTTGTSQTSPAHHHTYWNFTLGTSVYFIKDGTSVSNYGYSVITETDTEGNVISDRLTLKAQKAVPGEYLGIYNYDDNFFKEYGFTLSDHVSGLEPQKAESGLDISARCKIDLEADSFVYTGKEIKPAVTVTDGYHNGTFECVLKEGTDYELSYVNNTEIGSEASVTITGLGDYAGSSVTKTFRITKALDKSMFNVDTEKVVFKGAAWIKTVTPLTGLIEGTDYTVAHFNNAFPGTAQIVISGMGLYSGTLTYEYQILPKAITEDEFTVDTSEKSYTGEAIEPSVSSTLRKGLNYKVSYENNINAGTGKIIITGNGNYDGTLTYEFTINPVSLTKSYFTVDQKAKTFTGSALKTTVKSSLKSGTDFTVSYKNNKAVGTATVTITGKGNYSGSLKYTYKINLAKTVITKATVGKKKLTLQWKNSGAKKYIVSYRVKGTSKWLSKTVTSNKVVLKSLKSSKKYQVKVTSVNGSQKTVSAVKTTSKIK